MPLTPVAAQEAAALLVAAHRSGNPLDHLPGSCRPATIADAYAIQDEVTRALGPVGGWKVGMGSADAEPSCAPVYRDAILPSGASLDPRRYHGLALEIEFAFRLRHDLPLRAGPYGHEEIVAAIDFLPLIEVIGSRYRDRTALSAAEQLADANGNGALILGTPVEDWRGLDFREQLVTLTIDGELVQSARNTHPAGDPVRLVVWQANHVASRCGGLKSGDIVTTGSLQGATPAAAGVRAFGDWGCWGRVEVNITR
ncbi:MAG: fumarylacetoacetate hydrolase family protein [Aliidongia sp.]